MTKTMWQKMKDWERKVLEDQKKKNEEQKGKFDIFEAMCWGAIMAPILGSIKK